MTYDDYPPTPDTLFLNFYQCPECGHDWTDHYPHQVDDTCPQCHCRNVSPYDSIDTAEALLDTIYYTVEPQSLRLYLFAIQVMIHGRRNAGINGGET